MRPRFKKVKKRSASLPNNMQPLLLTLLIGTAFAMVNAAPAQNKLQSLQAALEGDDDIAKMARIQTNLDLENQLSFFC